MDKKNIDIESAYQHSLNLLKKCSHKKGFLASTTPFENYKRIWARDGCIVGLSALLCKDEKLMETFKNTLITLGEHQGRQGQIPSNVDPSKGKASYGMTSGRVDSSLWYVIGFSQYYKSTKDIDFLKKKIDILERTIKILEAWEYNQKDFIFIPDSGDWEGGVMPNYVLSGYALSLIPQLLPPLGRG